jgi:hypothetical protein
MVSEERRHSAFGVACDMCGAKQVTSTVYDFSSCMGPMSMRRIRRAQPRLILLQREVSNLAPDSSKNNE